VRAVDFVVVNIVATEGEGELACSLLRSAGIQCMRRVTNHGAGAFDGLPGGGPQEVIVWKQDLDTAREVVRL
jgi:hypothetical protein